MPLRGMNRNTRPAAPGGPADSLGHHMDKPQMTEARDLEMK
jgi:hypothetical protein